MPPRKFALIVPAEAAGHRLDQFLADRLPAELGRPLSKSRVRALIVAGAVYLNGKRVRIASKTLIPRARVEAHVDLQRLDEKPAAPTHHELSDSDILHRDAFVLVVNKPPGLPTQPTVDEARANLYKSVQEYVARTTPQEPYVGLHHRLDRDTSGAILFTVSKAANVGVAQAFAEHTARKTYLAVVAKTRSGNLNAQWSVKNFLGKVSRTGPSRFGEVRSGGDAAETLFRTLRQNDRFALVEAKPITGRTHQIRVHLSEEGLPILGDATYGVEYARQAPRLLLHAWRLELPHPHDGNRLEVVAPIPEDFRAFMAKQAWELPQK
jgi:RluA family pseudouridine synthase